MYVNFKLMIFVILWLTSVAFYNLSVFYLPPLCRPLNLPIAIYSLLVAFKVYPSPFNTTNVQENNTILFEMQGGMHCSCLPCGYESRLVQDFQMVKMSTW